MSADLHVAAKISQYARRIHKAKLYVRVVLLLFDLVYQVGDIKSLNSFPTKFVNRPHQCNHLSRKRDTIPLGNMPVNK